MTEEEWLRGSKPWTMLDELHYHPSDRKLRLFASACCRKWVHNLGDSDYFRMIELSEQLADGVIQDEMLDDALSSLNNEYVNYQGTNGGGLRRGVVEALMGLRSELNRVYLVGGTMAAAHSSATGNSWTAFRLPAGSPMPEPEEESLKTARKVEGMELDSQAHLLREVIGNPFRPITILPEWRTSTVIALATGIYAEKAFDRMPILADALQDTGCDNEDILNHYRQPGVHTRGCWTLDLLLGRE